MKPKGLLHRICLAAALVLASAASAQAVEARATTELNLRTGPGTIYSILDTLDGGEVVTVLECTEANWCYVDQDGPSGWVSARYLRAVPVPPPPPPPGSPAGERDCEFRLVLGPGAPRVEVSCTDPTPPPPPVAEPDPERRDEACFYRGQNFTGGSFCLAPGQLDSLDTGFDDRISSIRIYGDALVNICTERDMSGYCTRVYNDAPVLGALLDDKASSLRVFVPFTPDTPPPPAPPASFQTGRFVLSPGEHADLDDGTKGGAETDIWYRAAGSGMPARIRPIRGAEIALGDGSNRGFAGCSEASYTDAPVALWRMPVGTYVCVRTDAGRIAQFRVNARSGSELRLGFTTWAE